MKLLSYICLVILYITVLLIASSYAIIYTAKKGNGHVLAIQDCGDNNTWSLHGLWPNNKMNCKGPKWSMDIIEPIHDIMNEKWHTCMDGKDSPTFWNHEWTKHGTCWLQDQSNMEPLDYFQTAIGLLEYYSPLCQYRKDHGILPPRPLNECRIPMNTTYGLTNKDDIEIWDIIHR